MRRGNRSFSLLYGYVAREFLLSFCISFLFFFFIFFVNQILVLAREILLKNVSIRMVLYLVVLTIPQFLLYTFPFSSLTAASMTIGGLSSTNEIMAIRFSGMNIKRVFIPIAAVSLVISFAAILISNNLIPYTSSKYKEQYTKILRDIPTIELESGKVTQIDDLVLSNGDVEGNQVNDITLFDISRTGSVNSITAEKGRISLIDLQNFVYELSLDKPMVLSNKSSSMTDWGVASASSMTLYLDFSNRIPAVQSLTPSQISLAELKEL
ncbi:MAG: LptF/LptG family permease, partial [Sphaerochaetaceae bacterium]